MVPADVSANQSAVKRLINLPLVSSTWFLLSLLYGNSKENHPRVKSLCEVAETGVKTVTALAIEGVTPFLNSLQPQIAAANHLACKCLDKTEKAFPVLNLPLPQVIASSHSALTTAGGTGELMVSGTKCTVAVTAALGKAGTALREAMGVARSMLSGGFDSLLKSHVGQLLSSTVKTTLAMCDALMGQHLVQTEDEEHDEDPDAVSNKPGCSFLRSVSRSLQRKVHYGSKAAELTSGSTVYQLQTLCLIALSSLQHVSHAVQIKVLGAVVSASEICTSFWRTNNTQGSIAGSMEVARRCEERSEDPLMSRRSVCEISLTPAMSPCKGQARRRLIDFGSLSQTP